MNWQRVATFIAILSFGVTLICAVTVANQDGDGMPRLARTLMFVFLAVCAISGSIAIGLT